MAGSSRDVRYGRMAALATQQVRRQMHAACSTRKLRVLALQDRQAGVDAAFADAPTFAVFCRVSRSVDRSQRVRWLASCTTGWSHVGEAPAQRAPIIRRSSPTALASSKIPLPPLPEQRRIAEILDKADALRAKRRAALAQLDTLTQSIFLDMFGDPATNPKGWPQVPIGDHASKIGSGATPRARESYKAAGITLIRSMNVRDGAFREAASHSSTTSKPPSLRVSSLRLTMYC